MICSDCSEKQPLRRMGFVDPVLVCIHCARLCQIEEEFYKHHLKILENGWLAGQFKFKVLTYDNYYHNVACSFIVLISNYVCG